MMRIWVLFLGLAVSSVFAETAPPPAAGGSREFADPLKVKGQTRRLNMLLNFKGTGDDINFVRLRKNYRKEILRTQY